MMKLAIVFLPIVFAVIWMLFIGLRINKTLTTFTASKLRLSYPESITPEEIPFK